ncbi:PAS domain-containing sensor histidine kinase [Desulfocastanea catecholica]
MATRLNNQFYRLILDSIPVAIVTLDYDFKVNSFNSQAEKLTGYSRREAIGRPCYEILNSSLCAHACPLQTGGNENMPSAELETEMTNRHGEHITIKISAASVLNEDNAFIGYLAVIEDISRQKRRDRERNNFFSMIVHDMKSPLIGISGLIARLKKEKICQKNEKLRMYLKVMDETEQRLESMVSEFLEYCRMESGQIQLELGKTDVENVLQQVIAMHQLMAEEKNIALSLGGGSLAPIKADANRLFRVFSNIIDNAIKYSPRQSEITINTRETATEIIISFQDQGRGIKAEEIPYIFDAFYRVESQEDICGHGLGLAASRAIVRQHGGRIVVESEPGKGSVFIVRLPKGKTGNIDEGLEGRMI